MMAGLAGQCAEFSAIYELQVRHDDRLGRSVRGIFGLIELASSFVIFVTEKKQTRYGCHLY
jgi:hypothetical protein